MVAASTNRKSILRALATIATALACITSSPESVQSQRPVEPPFEDVRFASAAPNPVTINAKLLRPPLLPPPNLATPTPVVVMLHGCGGMFATSGRVGRRDIDWALRFRDAGYVVILVDSFGSRGLGAQCTVTDRAVRSRDRAGDVKGALDWLGEQAWADPARIAIVGWSNGGSALLQAVRPAFAPSNSTIHIRAAIAFYPGCRQFLSGPKPRPGVPLEIHMGDADDWTPPEPCADLSKDWGAKLILYPGAYHGFDSPNSPTRVRTGLAYSKNGDGRAHVGTHPAGRQRAIEAVMTRLATSFTRQ